MPETRIGAGAVPMTPIRDAATVIIARDASDGPHVFLVRRSARSSWLPERYVFPGGGVDPDDRTHAAALVRGSAGDVDPAYVFTAARETFEEAGVLFADRAVGHEALAQARRALLAGDRTFAGVLGDLGVSVDASLLRYFSRWITPSTEPRRFDARFFVARVPAGQRAEADAAEVHDGRWMRPPDVLDAHGRGEIGLIFPTIKHLERIAPYGSVDALLAFASAKPIVPITPDVQDGPVYALTPELEGAW